MSWNRLLLMKMKTLNITFMLIAVFCVVYIIAFSNFFTNLDTANTVTPPEGLKTKGRNFTLRKETFRIRSGSIHYFRVPYHEWSDRLDKLKAMGLNTVDIYIPWNLHEPTPGDYNFDDMQVNLQEFLSLVDSYELYAIVRPGPYICTEWDLGGLPSWLLRDNNMKLRTLYPGFIKPVERYFQKLLPMLESFQFSYGGPIIAFQIENEYGTYGNDINYIKHLKGLFEKHGLTELLFVCDNEEGLGKYGKLDGVLQAVNFMVKNSKRMVEKLFEFQPDKPLFVTEFWDGWFDHWGEKHHTVDVKVLIDTLEFIREKGGSFNLYMWHGGTNFGFMNGANANDDGSKYQSTITSYDYNAPLNEMGDITHKYIKLRDFIKKNYPEAVIDEIYSISGSASNYGDIEFKHFMPLNSLITLVKSIKQKDVSSMEMLPIHANYGQAYGYTVYQTNIKTTGKHITIDGGAKDFAIVILNNLMIYKTSLNENAIKIDVDGRLKRQSDNILQILVENCGRVNYGKDIDNQRKGLLGHVSLDNQKLSQWEIFPLEFKSDWVKELTTSDNNKNWKDFVSPATVDELKLPTAYKGNLFVHGFPKRTSIELPGWFKGVVFINGFNLGRYWNIGPQLTLYVPAQLLKIKDNDLVLFDLQGTTKKYEKGKYPFVSSTEQQDLGEKDAVKFLI